MPLPDATTVAQLLNQEPFRILQGGKQLTLAFAGLYIVSTTLAFKPKLVWETEKGYPRYYVPEQSLHQDIQNHLAASGPKSASLALQIKLSIVDTVEGKGNTSKAVIEKLSVGSKETTWVRFLEGPLKGFIRFERDEIGKCSRRF